MAPAPKKKRSPAQVAAGRKLAAGGRAAQARTRAAAIAKTGHAPARSKKQTQASKNWAAAGRAAQKARRQGKNPTKSVTAALPACRRDGLDPGVVLWLPGCNDELPVCAVVAIANHLLSATGIAASDDQMLKLHGLAGGDSGATLESVLGAAADHGLAGARLAVFGMAEETVPVPGLVYGLKMPRGYHAVLANPYSAGTMVSWGMVLPWTGQPAEAWHLEWEEADA